MSTFFDIIPEDVNTKIARILYKDVDREDSDDVHSLRDSANLKTLFRFAQLSNAQRRAVMAAMDYTIEAYIWRRETIEEWITLFSDIIIKLDLTRSRLIQLPPNLVLSTLEMAGIYARPHELRAIRHSTKLNCLTVIVDNLELWDLLLDTINTLQLQELNLFFDFLNGRLDLRPDQYQIPSSSYDKMIVSCSDLQTLTVRGNKMRFLSSSLWPVITALPSLERLEYHGKIPDEHVPFLATLSELVLFDMDSTDILNRLNKARITGIIRFRDLSEEDIQAFASLENLEELSIEPKTGAESALIGAIPNVSMLALFWGFEKLWHTGGGDVAVDLCICRVYSEFYRPDPAVLLEIVESAPELKTLTLGNCIIRSDTIEKLLQSVGDRLEYFAIAIDWQDEVTTTRLTNILWAVARWCTKLRTLKLLEQDDRCLPIFATDDGKAECLKALSEVMRVLPDFLSAGNIYELIRDRFEYREQGHLLIWDDLAHAA